MVVEIDKKTDKISVFDSKNNLLLKEQDAVSLSNGSVNFNHQDGQNLYGISAYTATESPKGLLKKNRT